MVYLLGKLTPSSACTNATGVRSCCPSVRAVTCSRCSPIACSVLPYRQKKKRTHLAGHHQASANARRLGPAPRTICRIWLRSCCVIFRRRSSSDSRKTAPHRPAYRSKSGTKSPVNRSTRSRCTSGHGTSRESVTFSTESVGAIGQETRRFLKSVDRKCFFRVYY